MSGKRCSIVHELSEVMERCVRMRGLSSKEALDLEKNAAMLVDMLVPIAFDVAAEQELGKDLRALSTESLKNFESSTVLSPAVNKELEKRRVAQEASDRLVAAIDAAPSLAIARRVYARAHPDADVEISSLVTFMCSCFRDKKTPPYSCYHAMWDEERLSLLRKVVEYAPDASFLANLHVDTFRSGVPDHLLARIEERTVSGIEALVKTAATGADWQLALRAAYCAREFPCGATVGAMVYAALMRAVPTAVPTPADRDADADVWATVLCARWDSDSSKWWDSTFGSTFAAIRAHMRRVTAVVDWDIELSRDVKMNMRSAGFREEDQASEEEASEEEETTDEEEASDEEETSDEEEAREEEAREEAAVADEAADAGAGA